MLLRSFYHGRFALGGQVGTTVVLDLVESLDPATGKWTTLPSMPTQRASFAAAVLGGAKLVVAGGQGNAARESAEALGLWHECSSKAAHGCTVCDACCAPANPDGGACEACNAMACHDTRDPTPLPTVSPTVSPSEHPTVSPTKMPTVSPTNSPSMHPSVSPTNSPSMHPTNSPTKFPTSSPTFSPTASVAKKWAAAADMLSDRHSHAMAATASQLYAMGGYDNSVGANTASLSFYSPEPANGWAFLAAMSVARRNHAACAIKDKARRTFAKHHRTLNPLHVTALAWIFTTVA